MSGRATGRVGVGVIGAGKISEQYLANLATYPDLDVRFLADLGPERAAQVAGQFGVPGSGSVPCASRTVRGLEVRSLPATDSPRAASTSAAPHIPVPPMPTR